MTISRQTLGAGFLSTTLLISSFSVSPLSAQQSSGVRILAAREAERILSVGSDGGVQPGTVYVMERADQVLARLRVIQVRPTESTALIVETAPRAVVAVFESVRFISVEPRDAELRTAEPTGNTSTVSPSSGKWGQSRMALS